MSSDRTKVLAHKVEEALRCSECGTRREEWDEDHNAYHVESDRCIGCEKIAWEQHSWREEPHTAYGIKFRLVRPDAQSRIRMPDDDSTTRR